MSGKVVPPAPPCGEEEHQLCRPGRRPLAGVEVFSKGGGWIFTSRLNGGLGGGGVHRSAKRKSTVAPPPAPLHQNPTRSHPSGRHRCHGAFVAARQVAQIKDPKICSAGGGRGFDTSLKHLLITDWPPSCLLRCLAVGAVMVAAWSQQARAQPAASRQQRRRSFNFLPRMWSHRG